MRRRRRRPPLPVRLRGFHHHAAPASRAVRSLGRAVFPAQLAGPRRFSPSSPVLAGAPLGSACQPPSGGPGPPTDAPFNPQPYLSRCRCSSAPRARSALRREPARGRSRQAEAAPAPPWKAARRTASPAESAPPARLARWRRRRRRRGLARWSLLAQRQPTSCAQPPSSASSRLSSKPAR